MSDGLMARLRKAIERAFGLDSLGVDFDRSESADFWAAMMDPHAASRMWAQAGLDGFMTLEMPGQSYSGKITLSGDELELRARLQAHVLKLAVDIGIRNTRHLAALEAASRYIEQQFQDIGLVARDQKYRTSDGHRVRNIEAVVPGTDGSPSLVIGAHYDTVECAGANDNASGVAALVEIARRVVDSKLKPRATLRFVAFTNEEPPYFYSDDMGSRVYAGELKKQRVKLIGMICLETIGYFSDEPGSQAVPPILKPFFSHDKADFIGFFSNNASRDFLRTVVGAFRANAQVPSQGLAASPLAVQGLDFSDHESFWRYGYPAVMVTDTAFMRYPPYHTKDDTPDKIEWTRFTKVTEGLARAVIDLAR